MSKISKSNRIEKIIFGGNGLTRIDGRVTLVPFSAPGDEAILEITQKKKHYQIGKINTLIKSDPKKILDLYCDAGASSILLSEKGYEVVGAEANRSLIPLSGKVKFICSNVETALPKLLKTITPDTILVNPPRTGLSK